MKKKINNYIKDKNILDEIIESERESKKRRVAIYVRVSTEEQAKHGFSIRGQISRLKHYCISQGWDVVDIYVDDGISGKNIKDRPEINRMIKDIKTNKVDTVLIHKIDRLTRSLRDLIDLVEFFNQFKCDFVSLQESIDTKTATGRMFIKIIGIFAEFERENIIERTRFGLEKKAREGYTLAAGFVALGYDKVKGDKIIKVNPQEAELVRLIFTKYLEEGITLHGLARYLNLQGYKTKTGHPFSGKTVKGILSNPIYIGKVRYCRDDEERTFIVEGKHEAIINEKNFYEVQLKLSKIESKTATKRPKENNYYCGTLYCGVCGERMTTHIKEKKRKNGTTYSTCSYRCPNKTLGVCSAKQMSHLKVEKAFFDYIEKINFLDVVDKVDLSEFNQDKETPDSYDIYKAEYDRLNQRQSKIMSLYIAETLDYDEFIKMKNIIKVQLADLQNKMYQLEQSREGKKPMISEKDIITNVRDNWTLLTDSEKLDFLDNFIDKIVIENQAQENTTEGKIKIKEIKFHKE